MLLLCARFYPVFAVSTIAFVTSGLAFYWFWENRRSQEADRSARLLLFLLIIAVASTTAFLFDLFVHQAGC